MHGGCDTQPVDASGVGAWCRTVSEEACLVKLEIESAWANRPRCQRLVRALPAISTDADSQQWSGLLFSNRSTTVEIPVNRNIVQIVLLRSKKQSESRLRISPSQLATQGHAVDLLGRVRHRRTTAPPLGVLEHLPPASTRHATHLQYRGVLEYLSL